jgi:hypothetical protein
VEENEKPRILDAAKKARKLHPLDIIALAVLAIVIVIIAAIFIGHTVKNHEIGSAEVVSHKVVASIASQNTARIRSLGSKDFQASFDKVNLSSQLKNFAAIYSKVTPAVDSTSVINSNRQQYVTVVYRYDLLKIPFYIQVNVTKPKGSTTWYVTSISTDHEADPATQTTTVST